MELNLLLKESLCLQPIISKAYVTLKESNPKYSLSYICQKCGITSKGLISDALSGRRKLPFKYAATMAKTLKLDSVQKKIFVLIAEYESSKDPEHQERLYSRIKVARKKLEYSNNLLKSGDFDPLVFSKAYCAFGIVTGPATTGTIAHAIGETKVNTEKALTALLEQGWIQKEGKSYDLCDNGQVRFKEGDEAGFHYRLIEHSMNLAKDRLRSEFPKRKQSFYDSCVVSVDYADYKQLLIELKHYVEDFLFRVEKPKGDTLAHFNIQVFPHKTPEDRL